MKTVFCSIRNENYSFLANRNEWTLLATILTVYAKIFFIYTTLAINSPVQTTSTIYTSLTSDERILEFTSGIYLA